MEMEGAKQSTLKIIAKYILEALIITAITILICYLAGKRDIHSYSDILFIVGAIIFVNGSFSINGVRGIAYAYFVKSLIISGVIIAISTVIFYL